MKRQEQLTHEFVEFIPDHHQLHDGTIYVSIPYATAVHKCCCGCGEEVVTPLSPTGWQLTFDGETISLYIYWKLGPSLSVPLLDQARPSLLGAEVVSKRDQFAKDIRGSNA